MHPLDRRRFLQTTLLSAASLGLPLRASEAAAASDPLRARTGRAPEVIDTNVYLFGWPFRTMPHDQPAALVRMLKDRGVVQAWAGSFDGIFHKDLGAANARLAEACRRDGAGMLVPFGSVNPRLPGWREDVRRIAEVHRMPGIRLHPGYHAYTLQDDVFTEVLAAAAGRGLVVQVVPWMHDERHHNPLMPVPTPALAPLAEQARRFPDLRIVVLNGFRTGEAPEFQTLAGVDNVFFDFAKLDVIDPLSTYLAHVPAERIVFGSYAPMFHFEAAALKMKETLLSPAQEAAIYAGNARRLL